MIENEPDAPAKHHAEHVFMNRLPAFRKFIAQERAAGRISTPPGQRVPVRLTLNRLPCLSCAPTVASWGNDPELAIEVSASTASKQETAETHIRDLNPLEGRRGSK